MVTIFSPLVFHRLRLLDLPSGIRGNRLHVGVRAKNAVACRGLRVGPSKAAIRETVPSTTHRKPPFRNGRA